jgi:hypothetical protein
MEKSPNGRFNLADFDLLIPCSAPFSLCVGGRRRSRQSRKSFAQARDIHLANGLAELSHAQMTKDRHVYTSVTQVED